jgi:hypothetical protein
LYRGIWQFEGQHCSLVAKCANELLLARCRTSTPDCQHDGKAGGGQTSLRHKHLGLPSLVCGRVSYSLEAVGARSRFRDTVPDCTQGEMSVVLRNRYCSGNLFQWRDVGLSRCDLPAIAEGTRRCD